MSSRTDLPSISSMRARRTQLLASLLPFFFALSVAPSAGADDGLVIVSDVVPNAVERAVPRVLLDLAIPGPNNASVFEDLVEEFLSPVPPELINDDGRACIEG